MSRKHDLPDAILPFQWHETLATSKKIKNMQGKQNGTPSSKLHLFAQRQNYLILENSHHSTAKEKVGWLHYPLICHMNLSSKIAWRASTQRHWTASQNSQFPSLTDLVHNDIQLPYHSHHISRFRIGFCPKQTHRIQWLYREVWRWETWNFICFFGS